MKASVFLDAKRTFRFATSPLERPGTRAERLRLETFDGRKATAKRKGPVSKTPKSCAVCGRDHFAQHCPKKVGEIACNNCGGPHKKNECPKNPTHTTQAAPKAKAKILDDGHAHNKEGVGKQSGLKEVKGVAALVQGHTMGKPPATGDFIHEELEEGEVLVNTFDKQSAVAMEDSNRQRHRDAGDVTVVNPAVIAAADATATAIAARRVTAIYQDTDCELESLEVVARRNEAQAYSTWQQRQLSSAAAASSAAVLAGIAATGAPWLGVGRANLTHNQRKGEKKNMIKKAENREKERLKVFNGKKATEQRAMAAARMARVQHAGKDAGQDAGKLLGVICTKCGRPGHHHLNCNTVAIAIGASADDHQSRHHCPNCGGLHGHAWNTCQGIAKGEDPLDDGKIIKPSFEEGACSRTINNSSACTLGGGQIGGLKAAKDAAILVQGYTIGKQVAATGAPFQVYRKPSPQPPAFTPNPIP